MRRFLKAQSNRTYHESAELQQWDMRKHGSLSWTRYPVVSILTGEETTCWQMYKCVEKNVDFGVIRCLVIAGPGFAKDAFKQYLNEESVRRSHKHLSDHRDKILTAAASTAYKHGLKVRD